MKTTSVPVIAAMLFVSATAFSGELPAKAPSLTESRSIESPDVMRVSCQFGSAVVGSRSATFNTGTCSIQNGALTIVLLDERHRPVGTERRFALKDIRSVSLQSRLLKEQLQMLVGDAVVALNILSDDGTRKSRECALAFFSALRETGVRPTNGYQMIDEYPTGATTW